MPQKPKWNELPCPDCKEPVSVEASRCPHCQAIYDSNTVSSRKKIHDDGQKLGLGCLVIFSVLLLGMCTFGNKKNETAALDPIVQPVPKPGTATASVQNAVKSFSNSIMDAVKPCDEAGKVLASVAERLGNGTSVYDGYSASANVENACRDSWSRVGDIELPDEFESAVKAKAEDALKICENAMIAKQMGGAAMKEVFDGDMRPSKMKEAKEKTSSAQAGAIACVAGIFSTAAQAGVKLEDVTQ